MNYVPGAGRDLAGQIETHLFLACANNSGSTFLAAALGGCRATWRLPREGQFVRGYAGPLPTRPYANGDCPGLLWASEQRWIDLFRNPANYDWPKTRRAWYFHARAHASDASVFVTKSPPHMLLLPQLARHFPKTRFLFMVRNPYAVCEGICRHIAKLGPQYRRQFAGDGSSLMTAAATHVANCFLWQRRNIEAYGDRGACFTYEEMCAEPAAVAGKVRALVPALDDLRLRRRIAVKAYDEALANMNERQIARLEAGQIAAFNRVFRAHRDALAHFGYELIDA